VNCEATDHSYTIVVGKVTLSICPSEDSLQDLNLKPIPVPVNVKT